MAVVIQNSRESKKIYGADVSGTVFKEISDRIFSRFIANETKVINQGVDTALYNSYGLKNDYNSIFSYLNIGYRDSVQGGYWRTMQMKNNGAGLTMAANTATKSKVVPDAFGMGLKDAVYLLENKGMIVEVQGRGRVQNQSLAAGTTFIKGQKISLLLN